MHGRRSLVVHLFFLISFGSYSWCVSSLCASLYNSDLFSFPSVSALDQLSKNTYEKKLLQEGISLHYSTQKQYYSFLTAYSGSPFLPCYMTYPRDLWDFPHVEHIRSLLFAARQTEECLYGSIFSLDNNTYYMLCNYPYYVNLRGFSSYRC